MERNKTFIILVVVVAAVLAGGAALTNYVPDDTFITLRYARNAARGDGFVFNAGERVEGYTNFLWLLLLVLAGKLGLPLVATARILSFVFSAGTLVLTGLAARAFVPPEERRGTPGVLRIFLPPLLLAASGPFLAWSSSGSELPLFTFLFLAGFLLLRAGTRPGAVFAVFGLLGLVRPEGTLFYAIAFLVLLARRERRRAVLLAGLGVAAVFYVPYLIWKWNYFGSLLPNTFYAKTGPFGLMLANGARYLIGFVASYGYLLVAGVYLLRTDARTRGRLALPLLLVGACWLEVAILGGDWMPFHRLLLPTLPFVMILASEGLMTRISSARRAAVAGIVLFLLAITPTAIGHHNLVVERVTVRAFALLGQRLRDILPAGTNLGCGSIGAIGYYTDLPIVDILGLTDRHIAREGTVVARQPGHFKTDGAYVLSRNPDLLLLGNVQIHRGERNEGQMPIKVQEKEITKQPDFAERYSFVSIPLGSGFSLSCFKRKEFFLPL